MTLHHVFHSPSLSCLPGPCDPINVTSVLQCVSDAATVSWEAADGAVAYTVLAREDSYPRYTSCRSNTTSCQLNQLQCGKVYNLTVIAEDATCNSTGSISTILMTGRKEGNLDSLKLLNAFILRSLETTNYPLLCSFSAPCSPSIQNSTLICGTNSSSLSWTPMADVTSYVVNATAPNGHTVSCSSATATCTLTDLLCSQAYMTTVIARGSQCDSAPGSSTNITTGKCVNVFREY